MMFNVMNLMQLYNNKISMNMNWDVFLHSQIFLLTKKWCATKVEREILFACLTLFSYQRKTNFKTKLISTPLNYYICKIHSICNTTQKKISVSLLAEKNLAIETIW